MAEVSTSPAAAVPVTDLQISQMHTTVTVEPTAFADGFDANSYDTADITSMLWINNNEERWVEIPILYETENFSASVAIINAGPDEFSDRQFRIKQIKGDVKRFIPYLQRVGTDSDILSDVKKLRQYLQGLRVAMVLLPARNVVLKINLAAMIKPLPDDQSRKTYGFKAYAPLPSFVVGPGRVPLRLTVIFKSTSDVPRTVLEPVITNPFGDTVGEPVEKAIAEDRYGDRFYYWKWQNDPVVEFSYTYNV